jgi:hypothetical protein
MTAMALTVFVSGQLEQGCHVLAADLAWRGDLFHLLGMAIAWRGRGQAFRQFDVGGVIRIRTEGDGILAGIRQDMELVRAGAADGSGVGRDRAEASGPDG